MVSLSEITEQFIALGIELDQPGANTCLEIANRCNIDASALVDTWVAYSLSVLDGAPPNADLLLEMEREALVTRCNGSEVVGNVDIENECEGEDGEIRNEASEDEVLEDQPMVVDSDPLMQRAMGMDHNIGTICLTYGPDIKNASNENSQPSLKCFVDSPDSWRTMTVSLFACNSLWNEIAEDLSDHLIRVNGITQEPLGLDNFDEDPVGFFVARICTRSSNERLISSAIPLRGTAISQFCEISVDFSSIPAYSFFPGQVIGFFGQSIHCQLRATQLFTNAVIGQAPLIGNTGSIRLVVAAGPFTSCMDLEFEPLYRLADAINEINPDVVILIGPAIPKVLARNIIFEGIPVIDKIAHVISIFKTKITRSDIEYYFITNHSETFGSPIYPTPQLLDPPSMHGMQVTGDPVFLKVNDINVGITSADILKHLGKKESSNITVNRLERLSRYILQQNCFYPLYPSSDINVDLKGLHAYGRFPFTPHMLILPSDLNHFAKSIEGCVVVNPGKLAKNRDFGTYADIQIQLNGNKTWDPETNVAININKLMNCSANNAV